MTEATFHRNQGYAWFRKNGIHVKGYLFDGSNQYYEDEQLLSYFSGIDTREIFEKKLREASGLFSVTIQTPVFTFFSVDRIRMFPIFWYKQGNTIHLTDDLYPLATKEPGFASSLAASQDFLTFGYVTGRNTLIQSASQLKAGEYGIIEHNKVHVFAYDEFLGNNPRQISSEAATRELSEYFETTFQNLISQAAGRQIVIPLSGGFDSRLIAVMLKKYNYKNVFCFSYGRGNNQEAQRSEWVAKKLNYPWEMIEYNTSLIGDFLNDPVFTDYVYFASNYCAQFFFQEYFAVKYLHNNQLIDKDAIFVPGHSGDFLAGSHLFRQLKKPLMEKEVANWLWHKHAVLNPQIKRKKSFLYELKTQFSSLDSIPHLVYENWDWQERQAKYIVNSTNVYNFFGYKHSLPMWDRSWFTFFKTLPFDLRYHKHLYDQTCKHIFEEFDLNFAKEFQPTTGERISQEKKETLKRTLWPLFSMIRQFQKNGPDIHFYFELTGILADDLRKNGIHPRINPKNKNAIVAQWALNKLQKKL